jgi:hypothetical protein
MEAVPPADNKREKREKNRKSGVVGVFSTPT